MKKTAPIATPPGQNRQKANLNPQPPKDLTGKMCSGLDGFAIILLFTAAACCVAVMAGVLFLGVKAIYEGVAVGVGLIAPHEGSTVLSDSMDNCIHGLEYFLLAPLGYLLVRSLIRYQADILKEATATIPAKMELMEVKSLIIGLLSGLVAADLVGHALQGKLDNWKWIQLALFVLLVLYYFALQHHVRELRREEREDAYRCVPPSQNVPVAPMAAPKFP